MDIPSSIKYLPNIYLGDDEYEQGSLTAAHADPAEENATSGFEEGEDIETS